VEDQHFSRRLRGLPPESQGLTHHHRTRSLSIPRTTNRPQTTRSESLRTLSIDQLEEGNSPPRDNFDPHIVEDYHIEDESPWSDSETETLLQEITDSLNRLSLRNPWARNLVEFNMSRDPNNPLVGSTTAAGGNVIHPSSTSGTNSGTNAGASSEAFHTPSGGPFSYGMPPINGLSHTLGGLVHYSLTTWLELVQVILLTTNLKERIWHIVHHCLDQFIQLQVSLLLVTCLLEPFRRLLGDFPETPPPRFQHLAVLILEPVFKRLIIQIVAQTFGTLGVVLGETS